MTTFADTATVSAVIPASILIVDDNPAKRAALRAAMQPLGHRVIEAESGFAALRNLMNQDFAVILLDVRMPIMDGFETAALVRQRQRSELTPIVFITAFRDGELGLADHFVEGVGEVMYAPVDPDQLRRKVATFAELFVRSQLDHPVGIQAAVIDARASTDKIIQTSRLLLGSKLDELQREQVTSVRTTAEALLEMLDATSVHIQPPLETDLLGAPRGLGRLLVVEDNLVSQRITVITLKELGYQVDAASDGAAAVQIASSRQYDAILMDCHMPKVSGYEATAAIRLLEGKGRQTPIVALTGSTQLVDRERCFAEGMNGFLAKPFTRSALAAAVAGSIAGIPSDDGPERDDPTTLDAVVIGNLRRLGEAAGEDLVGQLTELFVVNADAQMESLRNAAASGNWSTLFQAVHALSGASANVGAVALARLCDALAIESANGGRRSTSTVRRAIEGIDEELNRVRIACLSLASAR